MNSDINTTQKSLRKTLKKDVKMIVFLCLMYSALNYLCGIGINQSQNAVVIWFSRFAVIISILRFFRRKYRSFLLLLFLFFFYSFIIFDSLNFGTCNHLSKIICQYISSTTMLVIIQLSSVVP